MTNQNTKIEMTTKEFSRTESGKGWQSKPHTENKETIDRTCYDRITCDDTLTWFRRIGGSETAQRSYTSQGYMVTTLASSNPDRTIKKVRSFKIIE